MRKVQLAVNVAALACLMAAPLSAAPSVSVFATENSFLSLPGQHAEGSNEIFGVFTTYHDSSCTDYYITVWGRDSLNELIGEGRIGSYAAWPGTGDCTLAGPL